MTLKKKENALGRGLDALIKPEINKENNNENKQTQTKLNQENPTKTLKKTKKGKKAKNITVDNGEKIFSIDNTLVENVILEVHKNPRISLWSAKSAAVLRLLKKTQPEFSISKEASVLIEEAVKTKYPDLWEVFEKKKL
jgi:hypothetical protein